MRISALTVIGLILAGCQASPVAPTKAFNLIDLTGDYAAFYDSSPGMPPPERVDAFKVKFETLFPGFYDPERVKSYATREQYDARIARSFDAFAEIRPRYERSASTFAAMLTPARDDFARNFPDVAPLGNIYLLHSLGEMDGGIRTIGGRRYLVFGADVMARLYAPGDERPFFQHELFHVYHGQFFGDCEEVWCALWQEGLAVYVSEQLNPGATDAQMTLTSPRPIRPEVDANLPAAVCAVRARLRSEKPEDYAPLFLGSGNLDGLPPRFGYYVGYLVVRDAARTRTMRDLAHMSTTEARPVVEASLAALVERCP